MNNQCIKCNTVNPEGSVFCNHCGSQLEQAGSKLDVQNQQAQVDLDELKQDLEEKALEVKHEMLEDFEEKATKWVKLQFVAATTAISIVIALLAYAGFSGFDASKEYQELAQEYIKKVTDADNELNQRTESFQMLSDNATNRIDKVMDELNNINTDEINQHKRELQAQIDRVAALEKALKGQIEKVNKVENSRFHVLVHYRESAPQLLDKNIEYMEGVLYDRGYILERKNIANVSSDRQEILYYSKNKHIFSKVQQVQKLLAGKFKSLPIRYESAGSVNPYQIVIKLCPQANAADSRCTIEPSNGN